MKDKVDQKKSHSPKAEENLRVHNHKERQDHHAHNQEEDHNPHDHSRLVVHNQDKGLVPLDHSQEEDHSPHFRSGTKDAIKGKKIDTT